MLFREKKVSWTSTLHFPSDGLWVVSSTGQGYASPLASRQTDTSSTDECEVPTCGRWEHCRGGTGVQEHNGCKIQHPHISLIQLSYILYRYRKKWCERSKAPSRLSAPDLGATSNHSPILMQRLPSSSEPATSHGDHAQNAHCPHQEGDVTITTMRRRAAPHRREHQK